MISLKAQHQKMDYWLLFLVVGLTLFGVLMVYNTSVVSAFRDFNDKYFYLRQQAVWALLGLGLLGLCSRINYHFWGKLSPLLLLGTIFALVIILIPGIGIHTMGARRWLSLGPINFQPAEAAKLSLVLYLAHFLSKKKEFWRLIAILGFFVVLVMLEPDLGTTVVIAATSLSLLFAAGVSLFSLSILGVSGFLIGLVLILTSAYRKARFLTFLDLSKDPLGSSYHIRQILLALGSGGFLGVGLGASRQKYEYLPETMTDSIFAIIGEEMGFVGAIVLIIVFLLLVWRGFKIAQKAPDDFGRLLAVGIISCLGIQALVNLAGMVALVPLTGVPLPFISYGGSSLVVTLAGMGILLNISRYRVRQK